MTNKDADRPKKVGRFEITYDRPIPEGRMSEWNILARQMGVGGTTKQPLTPKEAAQLATAIRKIGHRAVQRKTVDGQAMEVWKGEPVEQTTKSKPKRKPAKKATTATEPVVEKVEEKVEAVPEKVVPVKAATPKVEKAKPPVKEVEEDLEEVDEDDDLEDEELEDEDEEDEDEEEAHFFEDDEE